MVKTRPTKLVLLLVGLPAGVAVVFVVVVVIVVNGVGCNPRSGPQEKGGIPSDYRSLYEQAGHKFNVDPAFLAAIGAQETDHGRAAGSLSVNSSGCVGPMQIGVGGQCGDEWARNAKAGPNGVKDPRDPGSAIFTAASILKDQKHAPPIGASEGAYKKAACGYYGACEDSKANGYADEVMQRAKAYGFHSGGISPVVAAAGVSGCSGFASSPIPGRVDVLPGANRPGVALHPQVLGLVAQTAQIAGHPLQVSTGTNHSERTVDGGESDHWTGDAVDIAVPTASPVGDQITSAALEAVSVSPSDAESKARQGGLYTIWRGKERIQVIWKTYEGGNHYDHVHIGDSPKG
jgi:hypothetical protein